MNVEIAQRLAQMRREKGYSQEALATELGLSRQAISKWERAESQPDTGNLIALADLYGVTLDELIRVKADISDDVRFEEASKQAEAESVSVVSISVEKAEDASGAKSIKDMDAAAMSAASEEKPDADESAAASPEVFTEPPAFPQFPPVDSTGSASAMPQVQQGHMNVEVMKQRHDLARTRKRRKSPWMTFPYPVLVVLIFLVGGFAFGAWHPLWILFLTIPFYYWIAATIVHDPNYMAAEDRREWGASGEDGRF